MDVEVPTVLLQMTRAARAKATGILRMISQLFQEKMVQEQEEHSSNFSGLKKRKTAKKLI